MSGEVTTGKTLVDLLQTYYHRLFPSLPLYHWLSYGKAFTFSKREISFTLPGDVYIRYLSYDTHRDFVDDLYKKVPVKIDIGCIYLTRPKEKNALTKITPESKEIVFDIDMTDYDDIRTCCSGANVCIKCWKWMAIACKIIDTALKEDFGFNHVLWVFSGRRGIHAWISDSSARDYDDNIRLGIVEYLTVVKGGLGTTKKVQLSQIHPSLKRALAIIDQYFIEDIVKAQDILGTQQRLDNFLKVIDVEIRKPIGDSMGQCKSSEERWQAFEHTFKDLLRKGNVPKDECYLFEELKLFYAYPRLDLNVTKGITHLLKSPFCVHPKTGKICVPFDVKEVDNFDPKNVPTLEQLFNELDAYNKKAKELEEAAMEAKETATNKVKIKDYRKTSLLGPVNVFKEFLRNMGKNGANKTAETDLTF
ncbi:DNA primase small subunit-like [Sitophilus oryzae]|uniref:DNA primase n=1 Tax=Sitophilus oryzae TaxID=7048 RepID=A0A6J2Y0Z3_SITOR|nr:DNA primase small subunit-like [Sitophilus oryzae]